MKIIITQRADDIHACLEGESGVWACGPTSEIALGKLLLTYPEKFGIEISDQRERVARSPRCDPQICEGEEVD